MGNLLSTFWRRLKPMVVDKAHCIHNWGQAYSDSAVPFLPEYGNIWSLQCFLRKNVLVYAVSAMLPTTVVSHIHESLHQSVNTLILKVSIDLPNTIFTYTPIRKTACERLYLQIFISKDASSSDFHSRMLEMTMIFIVDLAGILNIVHRVPTQPSCRHSKHRHNLHLSPGYLGLR